MVEEVPQNIKHKFGTNETSKLLSDKLVVHDAISKIYNTGIIKKCDKSNIDEEKSNEKIPPTPTRKQQINQYYDLGNHLRFSICHGYPEKITKSSKELCHNGEISKIYLSDPKNVNSIFRRNSFFFFLYAYL